MPSVTHETFIRLFRERPELAPELLTGALGIPLPAYTEVRTDSAELTEIAPTEYRADLVVLLVEGAPVLGIIVEVQLAPDPHKHYSWPVYVATLRARLRCDVCLLVVTPSQTVEKWARLPLVLGPSGQIQPLVVGPASVPAIDDVDVARRAPEMAVLSAMAHASDADPDRAARVALAALEAWRDLDTDRSVFYNDVVFAALGEAARSALEALMQSQPHREFQSDIARHWAADGAQRVLFKVLETRHLTVTEEQRLRIVACQDLAQFERWVERAVTIATVDELFT